MRTLWRSGGVAATAEPVKDCPGDEATDVVRMGTIVRNLFMKRRRERGK